MNLRDAPRILEIQEFGVRPSNSATTFIFSNLMSAQLYTQQKRASKPVFLYCSQSGIESNKQISKKGMT